MSAYQNQCLQKLVPMKAVLRTASDRFNKEMGSILIKW